METKEPYLVEYAEFMKNYAAGQTSGEAVGEVIARLAQYFCEKNITLAACDQRFSKINATIADSVDELTDKPISMAKADIMAKESKEYVDYSNAKANLQNIEQCINALKSLQKGVLQEWNYGAAT